MADVEEDDDFGDFTTADTPSMNGVPSPETAPSEEDDFGDFASSAEGKPPEDQSRQQPRHPQDNGDAEPSGADLPIHNTAGVAGNIDSVKENTDDPMGRVETAEKAGGRSESSSHSNYDTAREEEDDEFGDFDGSASEQDNQATEKKNGSDEVSSHIENKQPEEQSAAAAGTEDDDFGDFGDVNLAVSETSASFPVCNPNDESFGDFNGPSSPKESELDPAPATAPQPTTPTDDDDFRDFGDFNGPAAETDNGNNDIESKPTEDSFGDFDEAVSYTENDAAHADLVAPPPQDENDSADFGDFSASSPAQVVGEALIESKATEESFGDFNEPTSNVDTEAAPANDDDGDFGDFGDFNEPASGADPTGVPEPSKPSSDAAEKTAETLQTTDDDDFGDFGDFDSATNTDPNQNESHSNQNDANAKPASSDFGASFDVQPLSAPSMEEQDPLLHKARTIFSKVFEGFKLEGVDEKTESVSDKMALSELTASMGSDYDSKSDELLVKKFQAALNEIKQEQPPPKFIVAECESFSPNSHFSVRIDRESAGSGVPTQQASTGTPRQPLQKQTSSTNSSLEQTSRSNDAQQAQTGTMVQLPPRGSNKSLDTTGETLSQKTQTLLKQIPDLSYMLHSSLRLPSNSK